MADLKTICIDGECRDIPQQGATIIPSDANPLMDGTATPGTSDKYAREGHVHPTDTTRAPLASPAFTGTPTTPTAALATNNTQIASTAFVKSAIANAIWGEQMANTINDRSVANNTNVDVTIGTAGKPGLLVGHLYVNWASASGGQRSAQIVRDTTALFGTRIDQPTSNTTWLDVPVVMWVSAGQVVKARLWQSSGATLRAGTISFYGFIMNN